jgi:hypothetical protein
MEPSLRPTPVMAITIDHTLSVRPIDGNPKNVDISRTFELVSPLHANGLRVRCLEANEKSEWFDMLQLVIESESTVASSNKGQGGGATQQKAKKVIGSGAKDVFVKYDAMISEKNAEIEKLQRELERIRAVGRSTGSGSTPTRRSVGRSVSGMSVTSSASRRTESSTVKSTKRRLKRTNSAVSMASAALSIGRRSSVGRRGSKGRTSRVDEADSLGEGEEEEEEQIWVTEGSRQRQQAEAYTKPSKPKQRLFMSDS